METESITVSSEHIQDHVGYWFNIENMRSCLSGESVVFDSDEDLLDFFGLSHEYLRRAKRKFGAEYAKRNPDSPFIN
jgi:hypothetical protein